MTTFAGIVFCAWVVRHYAWQSPIDRVEAFVLCALTVFWCLKGDMP